LQAPLGERIMACARRFSEKVGQFFLRAMS
jgi:hypothetical protein